MQNYTLFLSDFNEICISSTDIRKILIFNENCRVRAEFYADRRTDMMKLVVLFAILQTRLKQLFNGFYQYKTREYKRKGERAKDLQK
jgi:hypothetical protein